VKAHGGVLDDAQEVVEAVVGTCEDGRVGAHVLPPPPEEPRKEPRGGARRARRHQHPSECCRLEAEAKGLQEVSRAEDGLWVSHGVSRSVNLGARVMARRRYGANDLIDLKNDSLFLGVLPEAFERQGLLYALEEERSKYRHREQLHCSYPIDVNHLCSNLHEAAHEPFGQLSR
jgi:hypothetical protein